ncbi:MAG: hypothetical protein MUO50_03950, partial [Longimicrobiales bacterium]|nr:hypothetical protein [Longimicrobiales bacterium]
GGMKGRGRGRLTDMGENLGDRPGIGEDRNEREGRLAGWADEGKHLIDPSQQSGPPGGPGRGGVRWLGCWERKARTGEWNGEGIILVGPFDDEGPQWSLGGEDTVVTVAVAVDVGWGENRGEAVQELEGGEAQGSLAGQVGPREEVEDLVGTTGDEVEAFESKRRSGAIPNQPFEAGPVGGFDTNASIQAEPAAVVSGQHVVRVMGLQEAVAAEEGFRTGRVLIRVIPDPLEESVQDDEMVMKVRVQRRAEAMEEAHGSEGGADWSGWTGLPEGGPESPKEDVKNGAGGPGSVMEEGPEAFGDGQHPLAHRHMGENGVHQVSRRLGHALGVA